MDEHNTAQDNGDAAHLPAMTAAFASRSSSAGLFAMPVRRGHHPEDIALKSSTELPPGVGIPSFGSGKGAAADAAHFILTQLTGAPKPFEQLSIDKHRKLHGQVVGWDEYVQEHGLRAAFDLFEENGANALEEAKQ